MRKHATILGVCLVLSLAAAAPVHAAMGPRWGAIGHGRDLGIGGYVGTAAGFSLKWFAGAGLALNIYAGWDHYWLPRYPTLRGEIDLIFHWSIAHGGHAWEMLIGPGIGGGAGWWRRPGFDTFCDSWADRTHCWGPFARGLFHWSMLFNRGPFDIFVEPSIWSALWPGVRFDWDLFVGAHYYF